MIVFQSRRDEFDALISMHYYDTVAKRVIARADFKANAQQFYVSSKANNWKGDWHTHEIDARAALDALIA